MKSSQESTARAEEQTELDAWISRHDRIYAYLRDFYDIGGRLCQCHEDGLVLYNPKINICYAAGENCSAPQLRKSLLVMTDSRALAQALVDEGVYSSIMECITAVYWKKEPVHIERPGITTRPLTEDDLQFVLDNYHNPGAYESHIRDRIAYGMIGGLYNGSLAGFAGIHQEGSMGMLEVLPRFRRRGLAEVMEAETINLQLRKNRLPYGHIQLGNEASIALQNKMGLSIDHRPMFWVG